MKTIIAVWKNGQIVPTQRVDWPEGTALSVEPIEDSLVNDPDGDLLGDDDAFPGCALWNGKSTFRGRNVTAR
jgi:hypothetical protein